VLATIVSAHGWGCHLAMVDVLEAKFTKAYVHPISGAQ